VIEDIPPFPKWKKGNLGILNSKVKMTPALVQELQGYFQALLRQLKSDPSKQAGQLFFNFFEADMLRNIAPTAKLPNGIYEYDVRDFEAIRAGKKPRNLANDLFGLRQNILPALWKSGK
jgi:hypothetical protein